MSKFNKTQVDAVFSKVNNGIWEAKKYHAKQITKQILIGIWSVTVFPVILLFMFITDER